jgi:hypothetical protein
MFISQGGAVKNTIGKKQSTELDPGESAVSMGGTLLPAQGAGQIRDTLTGAVIG